MLLNVNGGLVLSLLAPCSRWASVHGVSSPVLPLLTWPLPVQSWEFLPVPLSMLKNPWVDWTVWTS